MYITKVALIALLLPVFSATAEDIKAPPTIFAVEQYNNVPEQDPLSFMSYGEVPVMESADAFSTSVTEILDVIDRPLLKEGPYKAQISMVNRRTNILTVQKFNEVENNHTFKNINIHVAQCIQDYQSVLGNDIAFVELTDEQANVLFTGWIYKKRPSLNTFEHPIYSLALLSCS